MVKLVAAAVSLLATEEVEVEVEVVGASVVTVWASAGVGLLRVDRCLGSGASEVLPGMKEWYCRCLWVGGCPAARERGVACGLLGWLTRGRPHTLTIRPPALMPAINAESYTLLAASSLAVA